MSSNEMSKIIRTEELKEKIKTLWRSPVDMVRDNMAVMNILEGALDAFWRPSSRTDLIGGKKVYSADEDVLMNPINYLEGALAFIVIGLSAGIDKITRNGINASESNKLSQVLKGIVITIPNLLRVGVGYLNIGINTALRLTRAGARNLIQKLIPNRDKDKTEKNEDDQIIAATKQNLGTDTDRETLSGEFSRLWKAWPEYFRMDNSNFLRKLSRLAVPFISPFHPSRALKRRLANPSDTVQTSLALNPPPIRYGRLANPLNYIDGLLTGATTLVSSFCSLAHNKGYGTPGLVTKMKPRDFVALGLKAIVVTPLNLLRVPFLLVNPVINAGLDAVENKVREKIGKPGQGSAAVVPEKLDKPGTEESLGSGLESLDDEEARLLHTDDFESTTPAIVIDEDLREELERHLAEHNKSVTAAPTDSRKPAKTEDWIVPELRDVGFDHDETAKPVNIPPPEKTAASRKRLSAADAKRATTELRRSQSGTDSSANKMEKH